MSMPGDESQGAQERIRELENRVDELEQQQREYEVELARLEQALEDAPSSDTVKWLVAQVQGGDTSEVVGEPTTLERYTQMPLAERVESLPASEMRATLIYENWASWSGHGPYGDNGLTTKGTHGGANLRVLLREADPTVNRTEGEDLQAVQVYRAMRAVERLSDGAFQYDEEHTTPDNTDRGTSHALLLESPGLLETVPR